jgi:hypothetical protein
MWSLSTFSQVILTRTTTLTMTLDQSGQIFDQSGSVAAVNSSSGAIDFVPPEQAASSGYVTAPWSSDAANNAQISLAGFGAYGCDNESAGMYQMFAFSTAPTMPSCTPVALQVRLLGTLQGNCSR